MLRYPDGARAPDPVPVETSATARLLEIHQAITSDRHAATSEIHQELQKIASDQQVSSSERALADTLLKVAFSDQSAAQRADQTVKDIGAQIRGAKHLLETACSAVGWEPSPVIGYLLRTMIFSYAIDLDDIISLLGAMKDEATSA